MVDFLNHENFRLTPTQYEQAKRIVPCKTEIAIREIRKLRFKHKYPDETLSRIAMAVAILKIMRDKE